MKFYCLLPEIFKLFKVSFAYHYWHIQVIWAISYTDKIIYYRQAIVCINFLCRSVYHWYCCIFCLLSEVERGRQVLSYLKRVHNKRTTDTAIRVHRCKNLRLIIKLLLILLITIFHGSTLKLVYQGCPLTVCKIPAYTPA